MVTNVATLMGPDRLGGMVETPPDVHIDELISDGSPTKRDYPPIIKEVWSNLKRVHHLSYLYSMHNALQISGGFSVNESDLRKGLSICMSVPITVDVTPLLIAICKHVLVCGEEEREEGGERGKVNSSILSHLLECLGSHKNPLYKRVAVSDGEGEDEEICERRESEIGEMLRSFLSELGFHTIQSSMNGYFWHSDDVHNRSLLEKEVSTVSICVYMNSIS